MKKSEFWRILSEAALRVVQEYNHPEIDKKTFDWESRGVHYCKLFDIEIARGEENQANPVITAIRQLALNRELHQLFDIDLLIALEKAWEHFQEEIKPEFAVDDL